MAIYANDIIRQAQAWIGKRESNGTHREIIDIYNSHKPLARGYKVKYTDSWCSTFVSAVAIKCGATGIIPTECGCEKHIQLFMKIGCWIENEDRIPNPGDIIFYDWQDNGAGDNRGHSDHVGIVEKVNGTSITIIEGNISNSVGRRHIKANDKCIRGYGVPKYNTQQAAPVKSVDEIAKEVIAGKWSTGEHRKELLKAAGYNYDEVQSRVNAILGGAAAFKSTDTIAKEVIAGKWGKGADRKRRLEAAGYNYRTVQNRVNELLR